MEKVQSACSKPYEFYTIKPKSLPYDMSFIKCGLPKSKQTKSEDLSVTNQFDLLVKYTAVLCNVMYIDDKVHVLGNHGALSLEIECNLVTLRNITNIMCLM